MMIPPSRRALRLLSLAAVLAAAPAAAQTLGSSVFCGKSRMFDDSGSPNYGDPDIVQSPAGPVCWDWFGAGGYCGSGDCMALSPREPAVQNAEIRGWVLDDTGDPRGGFDDENEYHMDIVLDIGWQGTHGACAVGSTNCPPPTVPINTLAAVSQYIPGQNLIWNGMNQNPGGNPSVGGRHIPDAAGGNSLWGGPGVIVHLEIDGWGPGRGGANYQNHMPTGWFQYGSDRGMPIYWPVDLLPGGQPFQPGDYVRAVGTFWRDEDHNEYTSGVPLFGWFRSLKNQNPITLGLQCLRDNVGTNSWREMHTPDSLTHMPAPTNHHTLVGYSVCGGGGAVSLSDSPDLSTGAGAWGAPTWGSRIAGITWGGYGRGAGQTPPAATQTGPQSATFSTALAQAGNMNAYFDVTWSCAPTCQNRGGLDDGCGGKCACTAPQSCGTMKCGAVSNGCGGLISCGACASGKVCQAGQCITKPPPPPPGTCPRGEEPCGCRNPPGCSPPAVCARLCSRSH